MAISSRVTTGVTIGVLNHPSTRPLGNHQATRRTGQIIYDAYGRHQIKMVSRSVKVIHSIGSSLIESRGITISDAENIYSASANPDKILLAF